MMKTLRWLAAATCVVALPAVANAQQTTVTQTQTTVTQTQTTVAPDSEPYPIASHWLVSGGLGTNFGSDAENQSVDYSGTAGWLYHGVVGGEFQGNFSPDFQL